MTRYDEIGNYPFEKVKSIITEILKTVIQDGKGIEINTSRSSLWFKGFNTFERYFKALLKN